MEATPTPTVSDIEVGRADDEVVGPTATHGHGRPRKTSDATPKKQLTLMQRTVESKKRRKHLAEATLAQQRVNALERVTGMTARANANALAAQEVLMVSEH
jgi:hypothetical protein